MEELTKEEKKALKAEKLAEERAAHEAKLNGDTAAAENLLKEARETA